jgi:hypothetical protein
MLKCRTHFVVRFAQMPHTHFGKLCAQMPTTLCSIMCANAAHTLLNYARKFSHTLLRCACKCRALFVEFCAQMPPTLQLHRLNVSYEKAEITVCATKAAHKSRYYAHVNLWRKKSAKCFRHGKLSCSHSILATTSQLRYSGKGTFASC